ncbi:hypothetical protein Q7P37_000538 [Cladosporium fusiforme]
MANGDDGQKSSWTSWLSPGDSRRAKAEAQQQAPDVEATSRPATTTSPVGEDQGSHDGGQYVEAQRANHSPFVAFKHFVDDQFAALTEFPQNIHHLLQQARDDHIERIKQAKYEDNERQKQNAEAYRRWTGLDGDSMAIRHWPHPPNHRNKETEVAACMLIHEAERKSSDVPVEKIIALYKDENASRYESGFLSIGWFKTDAYSPVNLEANPLLSKYDTKWRHSFEDLLEATLDKPMSSSERFGMRSTGGAVQSTWRGPGLDWMLSLQCRGILPPQLPSWFRSRACLDGKPTPFQSYRDHGVYLGTEYSSMMPPREPPEFHEYYHLADEIATPFPHSTEQANTTELDVYEQFDEMASKERQHDANYEVAQLNQPGSKEPGDEGQRDQTGPTDGQPASQNHQMQMELRLLKRNLEIAMLRAKEMEDPEIEKRAQHDYKMGLMLLQQQEKKKQLLAERQDEAVTKGRCPDELGRAVGEIARREAERAADEEPGGVRGEFDFGAFLGAEDEPALEKKVFALWELMRRGLDEEARHRSPEKVDRLQVEAILEEKLRQLIGHSTSLQPEEAEEAEAERPQGWSKIMRSPGAQAVEARTERPQVLSTMTKTQTTRLPDGTVKTEVVLKRRFADGREETQTSTETSFDGSSAAAAAADDKDGQQTKDGKGWFWS